EVREVSGILSTFLLANPSELKRQYELFGEKLERYVPKELLVKYVIHRLFDSLLLSELAGAVIE
ncbi:MAG TPA: hypothetical protein DCY45_03835, partial [Mesotoga sp.]|nr:hypothetical protein [Mesotoga sp.]